MTEHIYTSDELLARDDLYDLQEQASNLQPFRYQLTSDELDWLDFVRGRYSIADWIDENTEDGVLTIDDSFSEALDGDCGGFGKAVCLSDDTALQKIFFWCYTETEPEQVRT